MAAFNVPKATALRVALLAYSSTDHISAATGKTIAITISKNGGAFGNPSVGVTTATEVASGLYFVDLSTTDTGTAGPLVILGTASGTDNVIAIYQIVDTTVAGSGVNVVSILGTASQGTAGYVAPDWGHVNAPTTTVGLTGTTISTSQVVASVTGAVGSVTGAVGSVTGAVGSVTGAVGSVTGNVGGNVVGSVASVTGNVGGNVVGNVNGSVATLTQLTVADGVETGLTWLAALRIILAAVSGKTNGFLAALPAVGAHFRDSTDTKNRITASTDQNGNRTSVSLDGS